MRKLIHTCLLLWSVSLTAAELPSEVSLSVGETLLLMADVQRAALGSGKVVSVATPERGQLLLIGEAPGETSAQLWLRDGRRHLLQLRVHAPDPGRRLAEVQQLLQGTEGVAARISGRFVVLEGMRAGSASRQRASEVAALYPGEVLDFVGEQGWESMVQLQVRVIEVRRDQLRRLGIRWDGEAEGPRVSAIAGNGSGGLALHASVTSELLSRLDLLQQRGLAHTVAEPTLSCRSGGVARFVAGGEVPIPVTDGLGSTDVQYKEYGVILEVRPRTGAEGTIYADVDVELSQIDASVRAGDYPGFLKRRTSTALNAREGETVAIAGLILREQARDRSAVPGLGAIPGAGALFRSTRRTQRETELVVLITPRRFDAGVPAAGTDAGQQEMVQRGAALAGEGLQP